MAIQIVVNEDLSATFIDCRYDTAAKGQTKTFV